MKPEHHDPDRLVQLDSCSALELAQLMNAADATVPTAVAAVLPQVAEAIDMVAGAIAAGGRLIYVGAGTSGRIAALDASEARPTFNTDKVHYVMAGGDRALSHAAESNEDKAELGRRDLARKRPTKRDVVVGLSASGRTPYTLAALEYARRRGARTVAISCNPDAPMQEAAELAIVIAVGPEVLAGSTRLKAGTAEKLVTNMITTGAMARLGHVYGNLMVHVTPRNRKLVERAAGILQQAAGVDRERALGTLRAAGNSVPVALIMLKAGVSKAEARKRLRAANGDVRRAILSAEV